MVIPMTPRIAIAIPTERGGNPRPPVNRNGSLGVKPGGCGSEGLKTGVERKTNHRELKVPTWKARKLCAMSVNKTFLVNMRRKGRRFVYRRLAVGLLEVPRSSSSEPRGETGDISRSVLILALRERSGVYAIDVVRLLNKPVNLFPMVIPISRLSWRASCV